MNYMRLWKMGCDHGDEDSNAVTGNDNGWGKL